MEKTPDIRAETEVKEEQGGNSSDVDLVVEENAVGYREYREGLDIEFSERESNKVRLKIDRVILPIFLITQALQFMDRTALNYANLFNYQKAIGLQGNQFNYITAMVYAGYFVGQYPCGWLIGRFPAQKIMAVSIFFWGITVLLMTQARSFSGALALRFFLGIFEAAVTPGLTLMTGFWYTRREIPLRQCIWFSALGWGGIVGSYMSMGISTLPANYTPERWQLIFYILGAVTCVWSLVVYFVLPDSPPNARFLNERERLVAVKRVAGNQTGIKNKAFNKSQALLALRDPKMIIIFISVASAAIPSAVLLAFSTVIIRDMGFSTTRTTELKSVGDATQIVSLFVAGLVTFNVKNSRLITSSVANLLCAVSAALMVYLPRENTWGRLVSFWLCNAQSVGFTVSIITISSNMAGYTHRSMASALIFSAYCWGNFAGAFVVKDSEAPTYHTATVGLMTGYTIKFGCQIILLAYMWLTNNYRDRTYGPADKEKSDEAGMRDKTEFENIHFRYVL
ncbi:major facilitator superfamily domain-containing protein [Xylariales sp. PMI_506]|nr:major facilitator superfamily domain-containing protein [Xylariales sp. PMI_506]